MRHFAVLFGALIVACVLARAIPATACDLPECYMNVTQLIKYQGYPVEQHFVQTEDGFILSVQRIPHGLKSGRQNGKPPVLLMHGLLDCSATWVFNFPDESLAFILADAGFDVWMGNWRGNSYSMSNVHYNPNQAQFWDWTWDDMAHYDLPAMLDYIAAQTGFEKVLYAGHSQGTMVPFAALSTYPEVTRRMALFVALAPVSYLGGVSVPLLRALADLDVAQLLEIMGVHQFLPSTALFKKLLPAVCELTPWVCQDVICAIAGCDKTNLNTTRYQVYVSVDPAGTSVKSMLHYAQGVKTNLFQMFDYGASGNKAHYGQPTPPPYPLHNISVPVALFSGTKDTLGDPADVAHAIRELPAATVVYQNVQPTYAHMDFVWGENAHQLIYPQVVSLMKQYAPQQHK